jgi:hypothetical protein
LDQRVEALAHLAAQQWIEAPRESEVDEEDPRLLRGVGLVEDEEVARVGVGMEQAVGKDLLRVSAPQDLSRERRGCRSW